MFDFLRDLDPTTTTLYLGALVPLIVGAITKKYTKPAVKAVANVATSAVVGSLAYLVTANGYDLGGFINHTGEAFISGIAAYYGFFKPSGIAEKVQDKTATFGVGTEEPPPADPVPAAPIAPALVATDDEVLPYEEPDIEIDIDPAGPPPVAGEIDH